MDEAEAIAIETELVRLAEVDIARLVLDDSGRLVEVHIVASPTKPAKQIARDVVSVAMASFGVEIDRRIVSVVQLDAGSGGTEAVGGPVAQGDDPRISPARIVIESVQAEITGLRCTVRVVLARDEVVAIGEAHGTIATSSRLRLVASATIQALRSIEPVAECIDIDAAQIVRVGGLDVAIATVVFVASTTEHVVSGSAVVNAHDESAAIARAVLDATNRKLPRLASAQ